MTSRRKTTAPKKPSRKARNTAMDRVERTLERFAKSFSNLEASCLSWQSYTRKHVNDSVDKIAQSVADIENSFVEERRQIGERISTIADDSQSRIGKIARDIKSIEGIIETLAVLTSDMAKATRSLEIVTKHIFSGTDMTAVLITATKEVLADDIRTVMQQYDYDGMKYDAKIKKTAGDMIRKIVAAGQ